MALAVVTPTAPRPRVLAAGLSLRRPSRETPQRAALVRDEVLGADKPRLSRLSDFVVAAAVECISAVRASVCVSSRLVRGRDCIPSIAFRAVPLGLMFVLIFV
jgi:hypothetical protein